MLKQYIITDLFLTVELHDVFESHTFIFLVFELCKNGELFDYLTTVVTLSEKKTKWVGSCEISHSIFEYSLIYLYATEKQQYILHESVVNSFRSHPLVRL